MTAALTPLPVFGVPMASAALSGRDSLLSIVQMPPGVPVGTLAIGKAGATNAGLLYTAKGAAAFLVPAASWLQSYTGGWHAVFVVATIANLAVAATALFIVKPMRAAHHADMQAAHRVEVTPAQAVRVAK